MIWSRDPEVSCSTGVYKSTEILQTAASLWYDTIIYNIWLLIIHNSINARWNWPQARPWEKYIIKHLSAEVQTALWIYSHTAKLANWYFRAMGRDFVTQMKDQWVRQTSRSIMRLNNPFCSCNLSILPVDVISSTAHVCILNLEVPQAGYPLALSIASIHYLSVPTLCRGTRGWSLS